ncbi:hypothetical protein [Encephalitozoon cuniculi GB-M1]|uniref:Uncharacterized protein n=2 Tax=Encephalitozoon cuniculi TaxID=6035 RepID=Q8SUW5_ENCCU|nr:uncharacterized protein ECU07_1450 [Encephalitozoon cuniculi GB-M1]AGE95904.1 hypothetical protein ECU07_1450 [Encephalitozoon cuniculi]KMV65869.1 hypothetical protein M970_071410 [Encephalitozoon cuniculi EcunIII-L]UYI27308.1 putative transport protein [Encephalitozoon cuniculi]CAD25677.1 hypothetical protein [Encephalitozoon cuniculi GB-M1]
MREAVAVFKKNKKVYSVGPFDPLVLDAVVGLKEMAKKAYEDEFLRIEAGGWVIGSLSGTGDVTIILVSRNVDLEKLRHVYESYRVCVAYGDIQMMDTLLSMYRRRAG